MQCFAALKLLLAGKIAIMEGPYLDTVAEMDKLVEFLVGMS